MPDLGPWYFLVEFEDNARFWFRTAREQYPTKQYVPFATASGTDDSACFDGADVTGQPRCYFVHSYSSPGWEDRGWVADFTTWLANSQEALLRERDRAQQP